MTDYAHYRLAFTAGEAWQTVELPLALIPGVEGATLVPVAPTIEAPDRTFNVVAFERMMSGLGPLIGWVKPSA